MLRVCFLFLSLLVLTTTTYALPFTIIPKAGTQLPTTITPGGAATAYYTVSNNTQAQRNNNFAKYLPPNTAQVTNGGTFPDACGSTFNLAGVGKPGSSCTLQLKVSGPVNGNDPDPHHHLFVCFPGGTTCAGTNFPLNVEVKPNTLSSLVIVPAAATLFVGQTQQFNATAVFSNGSTQDVTASATWNSSSPAIASISASGLATALMLGATNITATFNSVTSNVATVTVNAITLTSINITPTNSTIIAGRTQQYTAIGQFNNGTSQDITASATWSSSNSAVATIAPGGLATGVTTGTTNIQASLNSVNSNNAVLSVNTIAYVTNGGSNNVMRCVVNTNGTFGTCPVAKGGFSGPFNAILSLDHSLLYVVSSDFAHTSGSGFISFCPVNPDGSLGDCLIAATGLNGSTDLIFNATGTKAYIANNGGDAVLICDVQPNGGFNNCAPTGSGFNGPTSIAINSAGTRAFITNEDAGFVSGCTVNANGTFDFCSNVSTPFPLDGPHGIKLDPTGTRVYITNFEGNNITLCNVSNIGTLTGCTNLPTPNSLFGPNDLEFNRDFTQVYIANFFGNDVTLCNVNNANGTLNNCANTGTGFVNSTSVVLPG